MRTYRGSPAGPWRKAGEAVHSQAGGAEGIIARPEYLGQTPAAHRPWPGNVPAPQGLTYLHRGVSGMKPHLQKQFWKTEFTICLFIVFLLRNMKRRETMRQDCDTQFSSSADWTDQPQHHPGAGQDAGVGACTPQLDPRGSRKGQVWMGLLWRALGKPPSGPSVSLSGLLGRTDHTDNSSCQVRGQLRHH